jgi:hypothetical protein
MVLERQAVGMPEQRRRNLDVGQLTRVLEDDQVRKDLREYFGVGLGDESFRHLPESGSSFSTAGVTSLTPVTASPPRTSCRSRCSVSSFRPG